MPDHKRSPCPVACTLDILGDKWTLLVVRDLVMGKKTYSEFAQSPESIPTNILAERLKRLEAFDIIRKQQYQDNPVRYEYVLTEKGTGLRPVLLAMVKWGNEFIDGTLRPDEIQRMKEQYKNSK